MAEGKPVTVEAIVEAMNLAGITVEVLNPMMRSLALRSAMADLQSSLNVLVVEQGKMNDAYQEKRQAVAGKIAAINAELESLIPPQG